MYLAAAGIWRKIEALRAHPKGHTANLIHYFCSEPAGAGGALQEQVADRDPCHGRTRFRLGMCCSGTAPKQSQLWQEAAGQLPSTGLGQQPPGRAQHPGRSPGPRPNWRQGLNQEVWGERPQEQPPRKSQDVKLPCSTPQLRAPARANRPSSRNK